MAVRISRPLLDAIVAQARAADPLECCGLLLGRPVPGPEHAAPEIEIVEMRAAANVAAHPDRRFEVDPAVLIAAHRAARQGGSAIMGHYHSHPGGEAIPSVVDAEMAGAEGEIWLLVGKAGVVRAWQVRRGGALHGVFEPVELVVSPHARLAPADAGRHEGSAIA